MVLNIKDFVTEFTSGAAGGVACVYCGQPLDTIKVKMQTFPSMYKGTWDCFKKTVRQEGVFGLYKGSAPALLCNVSENAVLFLALAETQKFMARLSGSKVENLSNFSNACAGSIASIFSSLVVCPTELIKCRMQAMTEMKETGKLSADAATSPGAVARQMFRSGGITSFYKGLTSTWAREMPGYFAFFYGYELTRGLLAPKGGTKDDVGPVGTAFAGGTAGLCLWTFIFPIDVVKTRIQVLAAAGKQEGFAQTLRIIVRTEGFRALYSGLLPCVMRTYPANGALFVAVEYSRKLLRNISSDE